MISKILHLAVIVGIGNALYIDTHTAKEKSVSSESDNNWDFIKVFQNPPSHKSWYKYEPYAYPKYEFEYAVADKKTGDFKRHQEFRDGDRVHGEYSLIEPDGSLRKVEYKADDHTGFNAIVSKGIHKHGEHAYSQFGHTRFFAPNKNEFNQYFTENSNSYNDKEQQPIVSDKVKPVKESTEEKKVIKETIKPIIMQDINGKMMILMPAESAGSVDSVNAVQPIELPMATSKDMVEMVPMVMQIPSETPKTEVNSNNEMQLKNSVEVEQSKPIVIAENIENISDTSKESNKNDVVPDSNVASSYYHSRIYYGFH